MSLATLVRSGDFDTLENDWATLMGNAGPIEEALTAIAVAAETKQLSKLLPLVREHADLLEAGDRPQEAAELLGATLIAGGPPGELSTRLFRCAEAGWSSESWWDNYTSLVDFRPSTQDVRKAWKGMRQLIHLGPGSAIFHRSGWGVGEVTEYDAVKGEAKVRFASGRRDWFPIKSIIETCEVLEKDDLRGLVVADPEELTRRIKEEPIEVLTGLLRRYNGRLKQSVLKTAMSQLGLEGTKFNSWWRKARKAAEQSPIIEVTGTSTNTMVRLLDNAVDPADSMRRQLRMSRNLGAALTRVRDLLTDKGLEDSLKVAALETLEELSLGQGEADEHVLSAWLLLRNERGETSPHLAARLAKAMESEAPTDPAQPPALWQLFSTLPTARDQEACLSVLAEVLGEEWRDHAEVNVFHTPPGMVRALLDDFSKNDRKEFLVKTYQNLLVRPTRNPALLIGLSEYAEKGKLEGDFPPPLQRLNSYLVLATDLNDATGSDNFRTRSRERLAGMLTNGEPRLLASLLSEASRKELRGLMPLLGRGVDSAIDRTFTQVAASMYPDIYQEDTRPFWEEDAIWTSRVGLSRREKELHELREIKIPENSAAIGRAASYGDLSENSEWEAAMEEQRNLTTRAMEIEEELRQAQLIEDAAIPHGIVAPGTRVEYKSLDENSDHIINILGPWDSEADDTISYRSPFAQGLLGSKPGAEVELTLPTGTQRVQVLDVEPLKLEMTS